MLCTHEAFLASLKGLFEATSASGTVFLTLKRVVPRGGDAPYCLYRATDGKRRKFSTRVTAADAARFHPLCMSVIKGSTSGLKKVDKKKLAPAAKKATT